jgi:hypothetical protein
LWLQQVGFCFASLGVLGVSAFFGFCPSVHDSQERDLQVASTRQSQQIWVFDPLDIIALKRAKARPPSNGATTARKS